MRKIVLFTVFLFLVMFGLMFAVAKADATWNECPKCECPDLKCPDYECPDCICEGEKCPDCRVSCPVQPECPACVCPECPDCELTCEIPEIEVIPPGAYWFVGARAGDLGQWQLDLITVLMGQGRGLALQYTVNNKGTEGVGVYFLATP